MLTCRHGNYSPDGDQCRDLSVCKGYANPFCFHEDEARCKCEVFEHYVGLQDPITRDFVAWDIHIYAQDVPALNRFWEDYCKREWEITRELHEMRG